jgi:dihydroneopterin aldolase/D-erythro-7,8-dihydroneopterin triphosphate epimerase
MTMGKIFIKDLLVRCILGINDDERREKQDVIINIELTTDTSKAGQTDDFADAIDYRALKKKVIAMIEKSQYFLVEALAQALADCVLEDSRVDKVMVRVEKPTALRYAKSVGVEITRKQG